MMKRIGIVGAGAWGTALAITVRRAGREVVLWAHNPTTLDGLRRKRKSPHLPNMVLDSAIIPSADAADVAACDAVLLVTPAQYMRDACRLLEPYWRAGVPAVICAKGIERDTYALMSDVIAATLPTAVPAVLSGPSFAAEVAHGLPTAVTLACMDPVLGRVLVDALGTAAFRPYFSTDVVGAQIGGAVKNVLAIACGIVAGRGLGDNARAALITRGLVEIMRLATALGAHRETLMGLSGLGDLMLTANSLQSRNYSLGVALGHGQSLDQAMADGNHVIEGVFTAAAVMGKAQSLGVEMPICAAVDQVLNRNGDLETVIQNLLSRRFTNEIGCHLSRP